MCSYRRHSVQLYRGMCAETNWGCGKSSKIYPGIGFHCRLLKLSFQVTQECVEKIIRKDMRHPLTGQSLKEKDIIKLQRGATGFSAANDNLVAEKAGAAMSIG